MAVLPKRLAISLLVGAAIGTGPTTLEQDLTLMVLYVLTATGLIWITLLVYSLGGRTAGERLGQARSWVIRNAAVLAFSAASLFGLLFTGQAMAELLVRVRG